MIEEIARYRTNDGLLHPTIESAETYIIREMENSFGRVIDDVSAELRVDQQICLAAKMALVRAMVGDIESARRLRYMLELVKE